MPDRKICPYCGHAEKMEAVRCSVCARRFRGNEVTNSPGPAAVEVMPEMSADANEAYAEAEQAIRPVSGWRRLITWGAKKTEAVPEDLAEPSPKSWNMVSAMVVGLGPMGVHRFYTGRIISGIIWLFTFGLLGIGWIADIIMVYSGNFKDKDGRKVKRKRQPATLLKGKTF